jgi:hypothetical protein
MSDTLPSRIFSSHPVSDMVNMKIHLSNCNSHFVFVLNFVPHTVYQSTVNCWALGPIKEGDVEDNDVDMTKSFIHLILSLLLPV